MRPIKPWDTEQQLLPPRKESDTSRGTEGGASWYHDYIDSLERHAGVNGGHCPTRRLLIGSTCMGRGGISPSSILSLSRLSTPFLYSCLRLLLEYMMMPTIRARQGTPSLLSHRGGVCEQRNLWANGIIPIPPTWYIHCSSSSQYCAHPFLFFLSLLDLP
jgi:hypothetical protein